MGNIAIEFDNVSKQYALGSIGTGTLSRDLNRSWKGRPLSAYRRGERSFSESDGKFCVGFERY